MTTNARQVLSANRTSFRPTLGVVAISHNEEQDLPGFFKNLLTWVDEIVIVDDGSTDRTAEIANEAGQKVKFFAAPRQVNEYYSHQRNKGIAAATSEWLLHMDIDERVTPELASEIEHAIQDHSKDGYRYKRLNFFLHRPMRGCGWQNWNLIHLARRERFRFGGKVHETCLLDAGSDRVGQLKGVMWHLNDRDYAERLRKSLCYCSVEAETLLESGMRVTWAHLLFRPLWAFVKTYVLRCGFRDGLPGLICSLHTADAAFRAMALVWDRQHPIARESIESELTLQWNQGMVRPSASCSPRCLKPFTTCP